MIAIKSARLSDYNGKSLNVSDDSSQLFNDVEIDAAKKVQRWYYQLNAMARNEGVSVHEKLQNVEHLTMRQIRNDQNQYGGGQQDSNKFQSNVSNQQFGDF